MKVYRFGGGMILARQPRRGGGGNLVSLDELFSSCFPLFVVEEGDLNTWKPIRLYDLSNAYFLSNLTFLSCACLERPLYGGNAVPGLIFPPKIRV